MLAVTPSAFQRTRLLGMHVGMRRMSNFNFIVHSRELGLILETLEPGCSRSRVPVGVCPSWVGRGSESRSVRELAIARIRVVRVESFLL